MHVVSSANEDTNESSSNNNKSSKATTAATISDSDASSSHSEPVTSKKSRTRVGEEYQADESICSNDAYCDQDDTMMWQPTNKLSEIQLEEFLFAARAKHSYSIDQALAILFYNEYNIEKTLGDMQMFVPIPDEWTSEDKVLFEQAFLFHGKNFNKIRTMLPDKSQASLVNYYYTWKKSRNFKSLIDHLQHNGDSGDKQKSDENDAEAEDEYAAMDEAKICSNCDDLNSDLQSTPKGQLCSLCYNYWKKTGLMRPEHTTTQYSILNKTIQNKHFNIGFGDEHKEPKSVLKSFRRKPKGVYLNEEELMHLTQVDNNEIFQRLDNCILSHKRTVQANKQELESLMNDFADVDELDADFWQKFPQFNEPSKTSEKSTMWTQFEIELAIQGFATYGKDFSAISEIIETKSEECVRAFYEYHKAQSNLDEIIGNQNVLTNINELKTAASGLFNKDVNMAKENQMPNEDTNNSNEDVILL